MSQSPSLNKNLIIAGNWKMHKTNHEVELFFKDIKAPANPRQRRILAVSPTLLQSAHKLSLEKNIEVFSQNCFGESQGAFTGEISPLQLKEIGIRGSLVGHSERRQYFGETDESCLKRTLGLWNHDLEVLYCIGEKLEERQSGATSKVILCQLTALIQSYKSRIESKQFAKLIIAYEPVWAIGTGLTADAEQISQAHKLIYEQFKDAGIRPAELPLILYGGSVKTSNFNEIITLEHVHGGLIGGASLKAADFDILCSV